MILGVLLIGGQGSPEKSFQNLNEAFLTWYFKYHPVEATRYGVGNYNGNFQQELLRNMNGWQKMDILDAVNNEKKMIVDVKNKQFTEKGDKKIVARRLENQLPAKCPSVAAPKCCCPIHFCRFTVILFFLSDLDKITLRFICA